MINSIDLFCGAGGLTRGLLDAGINVKAGFDIDPCCEFPYQKNNKGTIFHERSIVNLSAGEVLDILGRDSIKLIAGCAPCQPFSKYRQGKDVTKDHKWGLLYQFERLVRQCSPELVTMENVPELARHEVFDDFRKSLKSMGYFIMHGIVDCRDYGVPQCRKRLVLIASTLGEVSIPEPTHSPIDYVTVRQAIEHLPPLKAGQGHQDDPLHVCSALSGLNLKRIRQSKPGGTWKDWDQSLVAECHKKKSGKTYAGVYGRMSWDDPAPTMTTQCYGFGNGRFGHPSQDRAISLREAAIFQSFPADYRFVPDNNKVLFTPVGRMIGNAVPVKLGKVIGHALIDHVQKFKGK